MDANDIYRLKEQHSKNTTERILSDLGKQSRFIEALNSPIGKELYRDAIRMTEVLLDKIINEEADEKELAEYRVLRKILDRWGLKMEAYFNTLRRAK